MSEESSAENQQAEQVNEALPAEDLGVSEEMPFGDSTELKVALEECTRLRAEAQESHDKYLRALAELENFKRRSMKERSDLLKYEGERILFELLEVVDNFERALQNIEADPVQVKSGVELIYKGLSSVLERFGVRPKSALGRTFDPNEHNALSRQVATDGASPGTVLHELKKAYFYKDKLIRPAEVVVAVAEEKSEVIQDSDETTP